MRMVKLEGEVEKLISDLQAFTANDPIREALLIVHAPISRHTLLQLLYGRYRPSTRLAKALRGVMQLYPVGTPIPMEAIAATGT